MREPRSIIKGRRNTHSVLYHYASRKQYDATNAWNVNNNGNVNTNNKYNTNYAVPVSDYGYDKEEALASFFKAYFDCLKNKRTTDNAIRFQVDAVRNVTRLAAEVLSGRYSVGRSICFIVESPVKREVFAACFRDRVIHHWIAARVEPLFEQYLYPCMKSNRKGKGSGDAIKEVYDNIFHESENYTRETWIYKFDLKGFFMSIDKRILAAKLDTFIGERYEGADKPLLRALVRKVVMHCPQKYCVRRCEKGRWNGLPADKSLFNRDDYHGIAIGNLTSQMFANFMLRDAVSFIKSNGFEKVVEYVDDFVVVHNDKSKILAFIPKLRDYLMASLGVKLHPRKFYLQHYTKGVAFVGGIIKPHRVYPSKRAARKCIRKIVWLCRSGQPLEGFRATVNSYLGILRQFRSYKLRRRIMEIAFSSPAKCYFTGDIHTMKFCKTNDYGN